MRARRCVPPQPGDDAEIDLGLAEARRGRGEAQVAGERHLAAAAEREAVDGGDRRLAHRLEQVREILAVLGVLARHQRRLGRQLGDVGARDERAVAGAREHRDAALVVVGEAAEGRQQLLEQLARERVEHLGAVDGHDRDAAVHADVDRRHPATACAFRYSTMAGRRGARREYHRDALRAQRLGVRARDRAADDHEHVVGPLVAQQLEDARHERHVRAREDRDADHVGVLLDDGLDDLLGGLMEARVDDLHAGVAKRPGDDLGSAIVAIEPGLRNDHADPACHRSDCRRLLPHRGRVARHSSSTLSVR